MLLLLFPFSLTAQLRLPEVWQSGMVIQRDKPIRLAGHASGTQKVTVVFGNEERSTLAAADGRWQVQLSARKASINPQTMRVFSGKDTLTLTDVLIGDVWLCAGQSNMAFPLSSDRHAAQALASAQNPSLRLFNRLAGLSVYNQPYQLADTARLRPENFYRPARWQAADSLSARSFSAVGYYFGQLVQQQTGLPIGLIHVAVGGSPAEAWLRPEAARQDTALQALFGSDWLSNPALEPWCIQRGHENLDALLRAGVWLPADALGCNHPFKPGFLYKAAIEPLLPVAIKGFLWYQGESNALSHRRAVQHERLLPALVADWRQQFTQGNLPFYFCQLSSIDTSRYQSRNWPYFRDSQRRLSESIPAAGMAVSSDVGHPTDVHPTDKRTVGGRLARLALRQTYGLPLPVAPKIAGVERRPDGYRVSFVFSGKKMKTPDAQPVRGFALGNADGVLLAEVPARLVGRQLLISLPPDARYTHLYYGYRPFSAGNLYSDAGEPLSTTRILIR